MTDRELLKSLLKKCAVNSYLHTSEYFIDNKWAMFNSKSQCTYLNLYNEGLTEIPSELFELKHLKHLELISNNIKTIPKSLYDSIDEVYIDDTVTIVDDTKPKEVKMTDRELVKSILKQCKGYYSSTLDDFSKDKYVKFNKFDQCTHLDLSSEKLTEIPDELFELKHLKHLWLTFNSIKEIPKSLIYRVDEMYIDDTITIIDDTKPTIKIKSLIDALIAKKSEMDATKGSLNVLNNEFDDIIQKIKNL